MFHLSFEGPAEREAPGPTPVAHVVIISHGVYLGM